jgi:hypothetical protein
MRDIKLPHGPWQTRLAVALIIVVVAVGLLYGICALM